MTSITSLTSRIGVRLAHGPGFWVIAAAFLMIMAFSTIPTPLYVLYQQRDGFDTWLITVIFAAYAAGVILALIFIGHLSDWFGRRRMILVAIVLELLSAAVFVVWSDVPGLLIARVLSGVGVGALTATATAHLSELRAIARPEEDPGRAATVSTVVNTGGLALGPLIAGALAQWGPDPLQVPYFGSIVLLAVAAVAVALVPETVERAEERPAYRPQRASVPAADRATFGAAAVAAFAGFAVFGLFTSLAPTIIAHVMGDTSRALAGFATFTVFAASAAAQVVFSRLTMRRQLQLALVLILPGLVGIGGAVLLTSLPVFLVATAVAGAGVGLLFRSSVGMAASLAGSESRGEVLALLFLIAYAGLAIPAVLIGLSLLAFDLVGVLLVFVALIALLVARGAIGMLRTA